MAKINIHIDSAFDDFHFDNQDLMDLDTLSDHRGEYWQDALNFVLSLRHVDKSTITPRQAAWATNIKEKLDDLRRKGKI